MEITGLSMAAHAQPAFGRAEAEMALRVFPQKYPEQIGLPGPRPTTDFPRDADRHLGARLVQRIPTHGSCHLLSAPRAAETGQHRSPSWRCKIWRAEQLY